MRVFIVEQAVKDSGDWRPCALLHKAISVEDGELLIRRWVRQKMDYRVVEYVTKLQAPAVAGRTQGGFAAWWIPLTQVGKKFWGCSENWGAKDAWMAALRESARTNDHDPTTKDDWKNAAKGVRRESAREAPSVKQACVNAAKALGLEHTIIKPGKSAAEVIEYWVRSASPEAPAAPIEICGEWEYANNDRAQCQLPKRHEGGCHWEFLENRADAMLAPAGLPQLFWRRHEICAGIFRRTLLVPLRTM